MKYGWIELVYINNNHQGLKYGNIQSLSKFLGGLNYRKNIYKA